MVVILGVCPVIITVVEIHEGKGVQAEPIVWL